MIKYFSIYPNTLRHSEDLDPDTASSALMWTLSLNQFCRPHLRDAPLKSPLTSKPYDDAAAAQSDIDISRSLHSKKKYVT